jgi:hypothetical protein
VPTEDSVRAKHPHIKRYRRALGLLMVGVVVGSLVTLMGVLFAQGGSASSQILLVVLAVIGPSIIILSAVGFATYLEGLEKDRFGAIYEDQEPPARPIEGFRQVEPPRDARAQR